MFSHNGNCEDHDVCLADAARAHAQWRHIAALHEATDLLNREMCLAPYLTGGMVVAIAFDSVTFYYIVAVELN